MLAAVSRPAGRNNFGVRIHEAPQKAGVFVVHRVDVVGAEVAGFRGDWR